MQGTIALKLRRRISTLLFVVLGSIALVVLAGLVVIAVRLVSIQSDLSDLRENSLSRLIHLSQLSQEAAATISIAPAMSANPTRFEFETLRSRIADKEASQEALISELAAIINDPQAVETLGRNADLLMGNLGNLTEVVSDQIDVRGRLEGHLEYFRSQARSLGMTDDDGDTSLPVDAGPSGGSGTVVIEAYAATAALSVVTLILDPVGARLSRNRQAVDSAMDRLVAIAEIYPLEIGGDADEVRSTARDLLERWQAEGAGIVADKQAELANDFRINALVEENALLANRLLASANNAFQQASGELQAQIGSVDDALNVTSVAILILVVAFGAGNIFVWIILKRRVLYRLDRLLQAMRSFADQRERAKADPLKDEIGEISGALIHYMTVIDEGEAELAEKSRTLEQLSHQLAKYLSPQVYESIFSGRQEVKVSSSRKKLTVFFSDVAGFTEIADRLESEELSQLLNQYLTEMSEIALNHGATIDKYIGDGILIFFGDPETRGVKADALACVEMAIAMRKRMAELTDLWREAGIETPLQIRIGIVTGYCTVGNFGSEDRMDYTIIGGTVNAASRLESMAEPGEILISYETCALVRDLVKCVGHGSVEVKGIAYPITTFRVIDSYNTLKAERYRLSEHRSSMRLDLDLDAMSEDDRAQAATTLRHALKLVAERTHSATGDVGSSETRPVTRRQAADCEQASSDDD